MTPPVAPPVALAPDWSLNTNHTGFVVADALGFYREAGVRWSLLPYADRPTAAKRVLSGRTHVGLGPQETVIAYADGPSPLVALAAVNAHNPSALAVPADSPVLRPRDLDGRSYASYGARFEMHVVLGVVRADGMAAKGGSRSACCPNRLCRTRFLPAKPTAPGSSWRGRVPRPNCAGDPCGTFCCATTASPTSIRRSCLRAGAFWSPTRNACGLLCRRVPAALSSPPPTPRGGGAFHRGVPGLGGRPRPPEPSFGEP